MIIRFRIDPGQKSATFPSPNWTRWSWIGSLDLSGRSMTVFITSRMVSWRGRFIGRHGARKPMWKRMNHATSWPRSTPTFRNTILFTRFFSHQMVPSRHSTKGVLGWPPPRPTILHRLHHTAVLIHLTITADHGHTSTPLHPIPEPGLPLSNIFLKHLDRSLHRISTLLRMPRPFHLLYGLGMVRLVVVCIAPIIRNIICPPQHLAFSLLLDRSQPRLSLRFLYCYYPILRQCSHGIPTILPIWFLFGDKPAICLLFPSIVTDYFFYRFENVYMAQSPTIFVMTWSLTSSGFFTCFRFPFHSYQRKSDKFYRLASEKSSTYYERTSGAHLAFVRYTPFFPGSQVQPQFNWLMWLRILIFDSSGQYEHRLNGHASSFAQNVFSRWFMILSFLRISAFVFSRLELPSFAFCLVSGFHP